MKTMDSFTLAYLECALWSSTECDDEGNMGQPLDDNYDTCDIAPDTLAEMVADCEGFQEANADDLADIDDSQAGHYFWLTRNGHGSGFWDRGLGERGDRLTDACKPYGPFDLYVGDDGLVHGQ